MLIVFDDHLLLLVPVFPNEVCSPGALNVQSRLPSYSSKTVEQQIVYVENQEVQWFLQKLFVTDLLKMFPRLLATSEFAPCPRFRRFKRPKTDTVLYRDSEFIVL